jgi:Spy/CpxP family protein refolding chaperone
LAGSASIATKRLEIVMRVRFVPLLFLALVAAASGQPAPYAGQQQRPIKSLSEQEVADYLAGRGMGLAKVAELNGYPGPAHVLELARELALTDEQRAKTEALFKQMENRAIAAGRTLVAEERALDALFASRTANEGNLGPALERVARAQAQVRLVHLEAHLAQAQILTPQQTAKYAQLRGYAGDAPRGGGHQHKKH